jgi:hypothetical protein
LKRKGGWWEADAIEVDEYGGEIPELSDSELEDENDSDQVKVEIAFFVLEHIHLQSRLQSRRLYLKSLLPSTRPSGAPQGCKVFTNTFPRPWLYCLGRRCKHFALLAIYSHLPEREHAIDCHHHPARDYGTRRSRIQRQPQLVKAAYSAITYVTTHIRSRSLSLKARTSKGNYLANLNVRTEDVCCYDSGEEYGRSHPESRNLARQSLGRPIEHAQGRRPVLPPKPPTLSRWC